MPVHFTFTTVPSVTTCCLRTRSIVARVLVGTSQVPSSNPSGSEFCPGLKKNPRLSSFSKHRLRPGPVVVMVPAPTRHSHGLRRPLCKRGRGLGVFSVCVIRPFFLTRNRRGQSYPRQAEFLGSYYTSR
jgi:hypothetical protein